MANAMFRFLGTAVIASFVLGQNDVTASTHEATLPMAEEAEEAEIQFDSGYLRDRPGERVGSMRMCRSLRANFAWIVPGTEVECRTRSTRVGSPRFRNHARRYRGPVRLAAFNAFQLGATPYKDLTMVASIMNRYDLVATNELMPLPSAERRTNRRMLDLWHGLEENGGLEVLRRDRTSRRLDVAQARAFIRSQVYPPAYLSLLKALRRMDASWSLVMTPWAEGESVSHREFLGFYYRARRVHPRSSDYCGGQPACWGRTSAQNREVLGRRPFVGAFASGRFRFNAIATHFRFNAAAPSVIDFIRERLIPWDDFPTDARPLLSRFGELAVHRNLIRRIQRAEGSRAKIFVLGDFNLSIRGRFAEGWRRVLDGVRGFEVFNDELTSISFANGKSQDYDHVVFDPEVASNCSADTVDIFDFLDEEEFPRLADRLRQPDESIDQWQKWLVNRYTVRRGKVEPLFMDESRLDDEVADYIRRVVDPGKGWLRLRRGLEPNTRHPFRGPVELVSDHLPVGLRCL